jgi:hypothetical protein
VIGAKEDKDIEDIMANINDRRDDISSAEEDNEEGMDVDLEGEEGREPHDDDEEEKKEEPKHSKKKGKKRAKGSDDDSDS